MSESGFLQAYFDKAIEIDQDSVMHSAFMMCRAISDFGFLYEYQTICHAAVVYLKGNGPLKCLTAELIVRLARYTECMRQFLEEERNVVRLFRGMLKDLEMEPYASIFLQMCESMMGGNAL
jgi:hypothetical protein